jgi:hypothetical protein
MKNFLISCLILFSGLLTSCNLSRTAVIRDTVKSVATSTPDFYQFYYQDYGEGKLKDYSHTVANQAGNPETIIRMIPGEKQDLGYYIIKPFSPDFVSAVMSPAGLLPGEIYIPLSRLKPILIPQRGN